MPLQNVEPLIDDTTAPKYFEPNVPGLTLGKGYEPRDYRLDPVEMFAPPSRVQVIPKSEWSARVKEKEAQKSRLSDIVRRAGISATNQGAEGFCWAYSQVSALHAARARDNLPHVPLSGHSVGCVVKNFQNRGGWCGQSARFAEVRGIATQADWPERSMNRAHDNPTTWQHAAQYRVTDHVIDLTRQEWDDVLPFDLVVSLLLANVPVQVDFNWWAHSVCALDAVEVEPGSFGVRIWNSWSDGWGSNGMGVLRGSRAIPDGAVATLVTTPSM